MGGADWKLDFTYGIYWPSFIDTMILGSTAEHPKCKIEEWQICDSKNLFDTS